MSMLRTPFVVPRCWISIESPLFTSPTIRGFNTVASEMRAFTTGAVAAGQENQAVGRVVACG